MAKRKSSTVGLSPDESWRVQRDMETIVEADKIRADAKRMAKVRALAKEMMMSAAKTAAGLGADKTD